MNFSSNTLPASARYKAGFGLIELLVSISIMVLVTSIVLARHSAFSGTVLLKSQAYEIALRLREIQLSAVSVATSTVSARSQYGARFQAVAANNSNSRYIVFATTIPVVNSFFSSGNYTPVGAQGLLDQRFIIKGVNLNCGDGTVVSSPNGVIVMFERPNYDADFLSYLGTRMTVTCGGVIKSIDIRIGPRASRATDTGSERIVTVTSTGQITVW